MRPFRFRAATALDFRKRLEDDARAMLTRAQNAASVADSRLLSVQNQLENAQAQLISIQQQSSPIWLIHWHRSWILRRAQEVGSCRQEVALAHAVVAKATEVLREAHKKRRALERLRDRLAARHAREMERQELADMNELATMRYLVARGESKEQE